MQEWEDQNTNVIVRVGEVLLRNLVFSAIGVALLFFRGTAGPAHRAAALSWAWENPFCPHSFKEEESCHF